MFVTGRLHGSVAATSECVPTVVLMHAHGQKSHKTIGFFDILQLPNCVSGSTNSNEMISKVKDCWNNREKIRKHLNNRIPEVKQLASNSFDSLKV